MKNKGYGYFRFVDKDGEEQVRKPTPRQRKRMLTYYLRRRSGRAMRVKDMAKVFCVSDRTMQKLLKELEAEGFIVREATFDENGLQKPTKYIYIGDKSRLTGKEQTLDKVYDPENPLKLRDFEWTGFWLFKDNEARFFNYEEEFGCDGPVDALNKLARKHGYTSLEDEYENTPSASSYPWFYDDDDDED
jgi:DNA-binding HxlR family transcriptional regulator